MGEVKTIIKGGTVRIELTRTNTCIEVGIIQVGIRLTKIVQTKIGLTKAWINLAEVMGET